jgi:hypothetical protein
VPERSFPLPRARELADDHAAAWDEWADGDGEVWEATARDELDPPS